MKLVESSDNIQNVMIQNNIEMPTDASNVCSYNGFFDSLNEETAKRLYEAIRNEIPEW